MRTLHAMTSSQDHADPIIVASYDTAGEAEVAVAVLRANGIEAAVVDLVEGGAIPVQGEPGVMVEVHPADADTARQLLGTGSAEG